ncbi:hypothetical protein JHK86_050864 [Glycine max]|nr:hypothetical protein JHK86_050864 [Glycine max]
MTAMEGNHGLSTRAPNVRGVACQGYLVFEEPVPPEECSLNSKQALSSISPLPAQHLQPQTGTLDTFIEEREIIRETEPYFGGSIDGKDNGPEVGIWEVGICEMKTLSTRKVNATSGAASVPDEVSHRSKGVQLCNTKAYQCTPTFFADSYFLNKFSSEVIAERAQVLATATVICEKHTISVLPGKILTEMDSALFLSATRISLTNHKLPAQRWFLLEVTKSSKY